MMSVRFEFGRKVDEDVLVEVEVQEHEKMKSRTIPYFSIKKV
jgi:hypothetical protein